MLNKLALQKLIKLSTISLIILLIFYIIQSALAYVEQSTHQHIEPRDNINAEYRYYIDKKQQASAETILGLYQQFIVEDTNKIPYQLADQTYWILAKYINNSNQSKEFILHIDNAMLSQLEIYEVEQFMEITDVFNINRHINDSYLRAFPHFEFNLTPYQDKRFLIKIKTDGPPSIPIELYAKENFHSNNEASIGLYGAYLSIIILMAMYNLVLYFSIKDKVFLVYIAYLFTTFFIITSINGFGYLLFDVQVQQWLQDQIIPIDYLLIINLILFTCYFLQYDKEKTWIINTSYVLIIILCLLSIGLSFSDKITQTKIFFSIQPFFYLFAIFIIFKKLKTTLTWAKFYFISWIPLLTGAAIQPLSLLNIIESSFWTHHAFLLGVMFETIFMAFALGERMRMTEQQKIATLTYHEETNILKSLMLENKIKQMRNLGDNHFSVIAVEPEQIHDISLYLENYEVNQLYQLFEQGLNSLFLYNDNVIPLLDDSQKICTDESGTLFVLFRQESQEELEVFIDSVLRKLKEVYRIKNTNFPLSATIGVSTNSYAQVKTEQLIQQSKLAVEQAKKLHTQWLVYQQESYKKDAYLFDLAAEMITAFHNNEFELLHQPQIDLKTLKVCGSEVLIRWSKADNTIVPNDVLIPLAVDIGLMKAISHWVFNQALKQQTEIMHCGYQNHLVSINMTHQDISDSDFYHFIAESIVTSEVAAENIAIELKDPSTLLSNHIAKKNMKSISALGVTLSVDDFGEGDSNISHISKLACQEIKLDHQLIENLLNLPKQHQIIKGTIKIAKALGLEVVAEGITSQEEEILLKELGCDIGQGYFYAPPMVLSQYLKWLEDNRMGLNR